MKIVYFLASLLFVELSAADTIRASYRKDVLLPATHTLDVPDSVLWFYYLKDGRRENIISQYGKRGSTNSWENYKGRVELDYITANIKISNLGCYDDKEYICWVGEPPNGMEAAKHTVLLGMYFTL